MKNLKQRKIYWTLALVLSGMLFSGSAFAMEHGSNGGKTLKGPMPEMGDSMIMLGEQVRSGVSAMTHLLALDGKSGSSATHHLMVKFTDIASQKTLTKGDVKVTVVAPDAPAAKAHGEPRIIQYVVQMPLDIPEGEAGNLSDPMRMKGHFGTDVTLDQPGVWHFEIVADLPDGQIRQYDAHYRVK